MESPVSVPLEVGHKDTKMKEEHHKEDDFQAIVSVQGLRWSIPKTVLYYFVALCTAGFFLLFGFWYPYFEAIARKTKTNLELATSVLIKGIDGSWEDVPIKTISYNNHDPKYADYFHDGRLIYFIYRNLKFIQNQKTAKFERPKFDLSSVSLSEISRSFASGIQNDEIQKELEELFGENILDIPIPSIPSMLLTEVLHPFYLFQVFSCTVWWVDGYIYYPIAIVIISTCSVTWAIYSSRSSLNRLKTLAKSECPVTAIRNGKEENISSRNLVPGDLLIIDESMSIPCDCIVVSGEAVVNEANLTGESNPVLKQAVPGTDDHYSVSAHKRFTLFAGTRVEQLKPTNKEKKVLAVVAKTGFRTTKGDLFFSILFPKPVKFKFYSDSYKFLGIMLCLAIAAFIWGAYNLIKEGYPASEVILSALDLVTIAVPPALPLILTIGVGFSINRLSKKSIFCTAPQRINYSGKINVMCFDKTGTLTEEDLAVEGANEVIDGDFSGIQKEGDTVKGKMIQVLATTHSISRLNGAFIGSPVDIRMFEYTKWEYTEGNVEENGVLSVVSSGDRKIDILRRFEFAAALQRMSVVTADENGVSICVKGSPEAVLGLCNPSSVPEGCHQLMKRYTQEGYYVLGCGIRQLPVDRKDVMSLKRDQIESDLEFTGFLIFENKLKEESEGVIRHLARAEIQTIMITGDNILTAIHVSKKCGIIPARAEILLVDTNEEQSLEWSDVESTKRGSEFPEIVDHYYALTGKAIKIIFQDTEKYTSILSRSLIYARVSPDQKTEICEYYIKKEKYVGMCGDGANDCGALKAAHVGIALSDTEASVVAPMTSKKKTVADVIKIICEGRCALVTSFIGFKYMILYPAIQLVSASRLYYAQTILGDLQYLYTDLVLVLPLATIACYTSAAKVISKRRPTANLFHPRIVGSLLIQLFLNIGAIVLVNVYLESRSWFEPHTVVVEGEAELEDEVICMENATTFLFANFAYVVASIAFNTGKPFRKFFYTNKLYTISLIILWISNSVLLLIRDQWDELEIYEDLDQSFRWQLWGFAWLLLFVCVVVEHLIIEGPVLQYIQNKILFWYRRRTSQSLDSEVYNLRELSESLIAE